MAQKVNVVLVDDIDESVADETVSFGLDGTTYEIDLSAGHAAELRDGLATWVGAARKAGRSSGASAQRRGGGRRVGTSTGGAGKERTQEIREWARANGHPVSERGRLSAVVLSAYEAAH